MIILKYQKTKYHNQKTKVNNIEFDSKKEANRFNELKLLEKAGLIKELEIQKKFELQPKYINNNGEHIRAITYIADFFYYDCKEGIYIVEDTKGFKTDVYILKKKLFEYVYPNLTIKEL